MKDPRKYIGGPLIEAVRRCHHGDHDEVAHDCWKVADCYGEAPWLKWSELVEFADAILLANEKWTEVLAARAEAARAEAGVELTPQERELVGVVPVAERPCDSCGRWMIHEDGCQRVQFVRLRTNGPFCIICGAHHPPTEDHGGYVQPIRP
jgi:hypothetical protein